MSPAPFYWRNRELKTMGDVMDTLLVEVKNDEDAMEFINRYLVVVRLDTLISNLRYALSRMYEVPRDRAKVRRLKTLLGRALL